MIRATLLGCGASLGVPTAGGFWGICDPAHPRNARTRASLLVQSETTNVLVDTTVDLRVQLNRIGLDKLDAVFLSHAHSDHINGIDDLRAISYRMQDKINIYSNLETIEEVERRWPYLVHGSYNNLYAPFATMHVIADDRIKVGDLEFTAFVQDHYTCDTIGFRIKDFAYSIDVAQLSDAALDKLQGLDIWVVDGGGYKRDAALTHATFADVFKWVDRVKPKMTYITNLTTHMDYATLEAELPPHIRPAYDGLIIDIA